MAPTQHSTFSASSAARLLACPGSYELGLRADDGTRRSTVYSAEGTLAHAIAEACIATGKDASDFIGETRSADGYSFTIDGEFADHVQLYIDYARGLRALGFTIMLERRVDPTVQWAGLEPLGIPLFGTGDLIGYNPDTRELAVGDLKFGAGVAVEADRNAQFLYYGSGAAHEAVLRPLCASAGIPYNGIASVTLTVIQPRAYHRAGPIRRDTLTPDELRTWSREVLYPGVKKALEDRGNTLDAGTWCRFCPVLAHCRKPAELSFETARTAFQNAPLHNIPDPGTPGAALPDVHLTDDKLADLLDKVQVIEPWLKALRELAHERLTAGRTLDGWKLVNKTARRKWASDDDAEMIETLGRAGVDLDTVTTTKLLSPAQAEKALGRKAYQALVAPHVVKNSSGTTIASEGDPRSRIERRTAQAAFSATANNATTAYRGD